MPKISEFYGIAICTYFDDHHATTTLDTLSGTVIWPNGADFAPEALYDLPAISG